MTIVGDVIPAIVGTVNAAGALAATVGTAAAENAGAIGAVAGVAGAGTGIYSATRKTPTPKASTITRPPQSSAGETNAAMRDYLIRRANAASTEAAQRPVGGFLRTTSTGLKPTLG